MTEEQKEQTEERDYTAEAHLSGSARGQNVYKEKKPRRKLTYLDKVTDLRDSKKRDVDKLLAKVDAKGRERDELLWQYNAALGELQELEALVRKHQVPSAASVGPAVEGEPVGRGDWVGSGLDDDYHRPPA